VGELKILLLEDTPSDAELLEHNLRREGVEFTALRVDTRLAFERALDDFKPDIILADYNLPSYSGRAALDYVQRADPGIPVIMVTGAIGEEMAVELLTAGARDYILKDRMARLPAAMRRVLAEKQEEQRRREAEEKFRKISEAAQDAIIMMDPEQRISFWNAAAERVFGYSVAEAMGQDLHALLAPPAAQAAFAHGFQRFSRSGEGSIVGKMVEFVALRKGGEKFPIELSLSSTQLNGQWHAIGIVRDITGRKRVEEALARHIRDAGERVKEAECLRDITSLLLNKEWSMEQVLDACTRRMPAAWLDPQHTCARIRLDGQAFESENFRETEWKLAAAIPMNSAEPSQIEVFYFGDTSRDGASPFIDEERELIQSLAIQIAQALKNRLAEIAIQHSNRALATLSAVNRSLTRATDEEELLHVVCKSIVEQGGYRMAWVGYKQHDENRSIKAVASAGYDEGYLDIINITWAENERGMGPTSRAIRSGITQLCQDFASDPRHRPWRAAALERGYASSVALPLANDEIFGVLTVYAGEINTFTPTEIERLEEMAGDLAFGVRALHIRRERDFAMEQSQQHLAQLRKSLEDTVQAIATIVEMRDPYTAGHQARVASLAAAIAGQMGLTDDRVHGIHLAGIVHDLGKIQTPAEILSKPGRISEIEYSLIKIHPHAGYEILKDIDFPWPIALMVLQHHERLDGSGYPLGLKGGEIMLEARILSVADVVEAISAHRPYRPGFGIDVALDEITKQRGIQFDPQVVDACLTLFREQSFHFK